MSLVPPFEIDLWNAWILVFPFLLLTHLSFLILNKGSPLFSWPQYDKRERKVFGCYDGRSLRFGDL